MDIHTDVQIPPVFYRTSSPSGPQPKKHDLAAIYGATRTYAFILALCFKGIIIFNYRRFLFRREKRKPAKAGLIRRSVGLYQNGHLHHRQASS